MLMISPSRSKEPGSAKTRTARLWGYVRDDRNTGSEMPPAVWFTYSPDWKGIHPQNHLAGYSGVLQADAYGGYWALYESGRITEAACMAHARRKIHDVHARAPTDITTEALQRIGQPAPFSPCHRSSGRREPVIRRCAQHPVLVRRRHGSGGRTPAY